MFVFATTVNIKKSKEKENVYDFEIFKNRPARQFLKKITVFPKTY